MSALKTAEVKPNNSKYHIAIVVSRFNNPIGEKLLKGAVDKLVSLGVERGHVDIAWVPGAWEIPVVAAKMAYIGEYQGIIALGAVIEGETSHHEYIANEVATALRRLTEKSGLPVAFGILTTPTVKLALARSGEKKNNKGAEAALHLLEVLSVLERVQ
jgi:6,7-dimethyl-8-ribityllumazine synthase